MTALYQLARKIVDETGIGRVEGIAGLDQQILTHEASSFLTRQAKPSAPESAGSPRGHRTGMSVTRHRPVQLAERQQRRSHPAILGEKDIIGAARRTSVHRLEHDAGGPQNTA